MIHSVQVYIHTLPYYGNYVQMCLSLDDITVYLVFACIIYSTNIKSEKNLAGNMSMELPRPVDEYQSLWVLGGSSICICMYI